MTVPCRRSSSVKLGRALLAIVVFAGGLAACAPSRATATAIPTGPAQIECLDGLEPATCEKAAIVVLRAVSASGWTPTHLWINDGSLAPVVELLFDPNANFPVPTIPEGGTLLGSAEVAFAETGKHAGVNLAAVESEVVATLVGYALPHPGWCSGDCPSSSWLGRRSSPS
jgi:hypothetical protein